MTSDDRTRLAELLDSVRPLDARAMTDAGLRQGQLTKPPGSLGVLEEVSVRLAGIHGSCPPRPLASPAVAVFAADHGVHAQGVTPWPQEVTAAMVETFRAGGAAVNVLARLAGVEVYVVDVGVAGEVAPGERVWVRKVRSGTADLSVGPAMTVSEARSTLLAGADVARELVERGHDCLLTGDMGIANTTASAALVAAFTGVAAAEVTGRGTGVDDATWRRKGQVVSAALAALEGDGSSEARTDPLEVLAAVGGLEHAALAGFALGAAAAGVPVILDGMIAGAAALVAHALAPSVAGHWFAGHRSVEPGHSVTLAHLGLRPLVDLDLRLGEGTGAVLALPVVQSAGAVLREMATFDSAGVART